MDFPTLDSTLHKLVEQKILLDKYKVALDNDARAMHDLQNSFKEVRVINLHNLAGVSEKYEALKRSKSNYDNQFQNFQRTAVPIIELLAISNAPSLVYDYYGHLTEKYVFRVKVEGETRFLEAEKFQN